MFCSDIDILCILLMQAKQSNRRQLSCMLHCYILVYITHTCNNNNLKPRYLVCHVQQKVSIRSFDDAVCCWFSLNLFFFAVAFIILTFDACMLWMNKTTEWTRNWLLVMLSTYLKTIISPWTEFHFASLIVKRKPCDINFTSWFEYSRWNVYDTTIISNDNICRISTIESFVSAAYITEWKQQHNNWQKIRKKKKKEQNG